MLEYELVRNKKLRWEKSLIMTQDYQVRMRGTHEVFQRNEKHKHEGRRVKVDETGRTGGTGKYLRKIRPRRNFW